MILASSSIHRKPGRHEDDDVPSDTNRSHFHDIVK